MKTEQPTQKNIVVTGKSQTGSAFGIVIGTGEGCFIPVAVASAGGAQAGSIYLAECILNPNELSHNNTPLMCVKLDASDGILSDDPPASNPSISSARRFTNEIMQTGVWTSDEVFCEFMGSAMARREDNPDVHVAINDELVRMFNASACVKFTKHQGPEQEPSAAWYTRASDVEPCEMAD